MIDLLADEDRVMPETRPDDDAYYHMDTNLTCRCKPCMRPEAERWRRKWRVEHGLQKKNSRSA